MRVAQKVMRHISFSVNIYSKNVKRICVRTCVVMLKQEFCRIFVCSNSPETLLEGLHYFYVGVWGDGLLFQHHIHQNHPFTVPKYSNHDLSGWGNCPKPLSWRGTVMPFHGLSFYLWLKMMDPGFSPGQEVFPVSFITCQQIWTYVFVQSFVFRCEVSRNSVCTQHQIFEGLHCHFLCWLKARVPAASLWCSESPKWCPSVRCISTKEPWLSFMWQRMNQSEAFTNNKRMEILHSAEAPLYWPTRMKADGTERCGSIPLSLT